MKIYVLLDNPYEKYCNPYVKTLIDGINNQYNDVEWGYGISTFWDNDIYNYDIIHIHWPNVLIWVNDKHISKSIKPFENRIKSIKSKGIKIISSCHNFKPHYTNNIIESEIYDVTYKHSDYIIHLGKYSYSIFKEKYPDVRHKLLLHHIYDTIYTEIPSFEESVKYLKLKPDFKYILCFGAFRSNEERELIIKLANYLRTQKVAILAPSFYKIPKRRNKFYVIKPYLKYWYYKFKYPNIIKSKYYIDDEKLKYYYGASSISLIQRLEILNSGNVPLGFYMKKLVVGPNVGNVGIWLNETQNPTFDPKKIETLYTAVDNSLNNEALGYKNHQYAMKYLRTDIISSELYNYYKELIQ